MSVPISDRIVCAVMTSIPSIEVRSTPQIRFSSVARSTVGSLRLVFLGFRVFLVCWAGAAVVSLGGWGLSRIRVGKLARNLSNCRSHSRIWRCAKW